MAFAAGSQQDTHLDCEETPGGAALDVELDDVVVAIRSREVRRRRKLLRTSTPGGSTSGVNRASIGRGRGRDRVRIGRG